MVQAIGSTLLRIHLQGANKCLNRGKLPTKTGGKVLCGGLSTIHTTTFLAVRVVGDRL
ncbi:hypothetical protein Moror_13346, partial [Moniliophthora roreri MCA 2997]